MKSFFLIVLCCAGIDYSVWTLNLGDSHVALQLWDTAGQERLGPHTYIVQTKLSFAFIYSLSSSSGHSASVYVLYFCSSA